jgi:hypothetical protein
MSGLSDYSARNLMNYLTGQVAMPPLPAIYLALFTAAPANDAGTGGTEVSGGSYARVQVAGAAATNGATASGNATLHFAATPPWIVPGMSIYDATASGVIAANTTVVSVTGTTVVMSNNTGGAGIGNGDGMVFSAFAPASASSGAEPATAPGSVGNGNATITFAQATANWGTVASFGLYDAASGGNLLWWDYLGNYKWLPFTCSSASPGVLNSPASNFATATSVVVSTKAGGTLPATSGSWSGVLTATNISADTFSVGVNTSSTGDGLVRQVTQQSIPQNVIASFAASALTLTMA